jgi:NH3-dependent NAD+ synthetase
MDTPREISPLRTFQSLVTEMMDMIGEHGCRGGIIGISGTDSILSFLICEKAFRHLGLGLTAVYYGKPDDPFAQTAIPFLEGGSATIIVDDQTGQGKRDGARWGDLIDRAILTPDGAYRPVKERLWVIGTRNRTEEVLGMYSNSTKIASVQPISRLWKSEVLDMCASLGVPKQIINRAYIADCGCGDPDMDLIALNPRLTDTILMQHMLELSPSYRYKHQPELIEAVREAVMRQIEAGDFKDMIPYSFSDDALRLRPEAA